MTKREHVVIIHYSCESFYERPDGSSPRVTSIAVRNLSSAQTASFSIHQMAERKGYSSDTLEQHYDRLEKMMLEEFYDYVRRHCTYTWMHWNMRDINFGFQALAHRYKVLGGKPEDIAESNLFNLDRTLEEIYGPQYIGHGHMQNLMEKNNMQHRDFLNGEQEAEAFENKEYVKLHRSTLRKVSMFSSIAERAYAGSLQTNMDWKNTLKLYPDAAAEIIREHWLMSVIGFVSTIAGIVGFILQIYS